MSTLDVGCGLGDLAGRIYQVLQPAKMYVCDVSSTAITRARKKVPEVDFFVHDLVTEPALPFQSGSLDLIVMVEVVWYVLPVLSDVFSEFARLLTPGGRGAQASLLSAR